MNFSPVGAAYSVPIPADVAPDGALSVGGWRCYKYASPDGLGKICVSSVFHLWLKNSNALCPFVHPKLPLAARLGHCWGARPFRWPFSPRRKPARSAPVLGRCNVVKPCGVGMANARGSLDIAVAGTATLRLRPRPPPVAVFTAPASSRRDNWKLARHEVSGLSSNRNPS